MTREEEIDAAWRFHLLPSHCQRTDRTPEIRARLAEAQNWRCAHCGGRMDGVGADANAPTFEHVIPKSRGGPDTISNLVIAHARCNHDRGVKPLIFAEDFVP